MDKVDTMQEKMDNVIRKNNKYKKVSNTNVENTYKIENCF